jgi:hypothetical protein
MAENIRIQGEYSACIGALKLYAEQYGTNFHAYFYSSQGNLVKKVNVYPSNKASQWVNMYFFWRHEYNEYDNSY